MTWRVLVSAPYMQMDMGRFRSILEARGAEVVVPEVGERLEEDDLLKWIGDVDGVICGDDRFTERVFAQAPRLRVVSKWGTGIDSIDRAAAARYGVQVCNTPNAFSQPVADSVIGYILAFARRLPWMDRAMRGGEWRKLMGRALNESTIGIIGVGDVGKAVVRRAAAFGGRVVGYDTREIDQRFARDTGLEILRNQDELLAAADFVSINCDLNPTSFHLISTLQLERMKETAVLINTARGPIVDEAALVSALQRGAIAGAALDVFEHEPLPADSPLRRIDNVMLAPHNSNSSPKAWEHVHTNTIENLFRALEAFPILERSTAD